jgi:MoaA/NifB/PqqE/SkfB family radical SAM enzyme
MIKEYYLCLGIKFRSQLAELRPEESMDQEYVVPEELRFAVTRKCDAACRHCYNLSGKDIDRLSADDFIGIMKDVLALNPRFDRMTLTGGEPMLEPGKVLSVTRFAKRSGIRVRLVTRGWELDQATCKALIEAGVTRIQVGLDSSGEFGYNDDEGVKWDTFHSYLRGDETGFQKTVEGIRVAVNAGMDVSVRYSLCKANLEDVVTTYRFISSIGAGKFKFRLLFPDGRAKGKLVQRLISGEEMATAQHQLILASAGNDTTVEITQPCSFLIPGRRKLPFGTDRFNAFREACPCGKAAAYVDADGGVKYCLFDEKTIGNVTNDSFLEVWNSASANEARQVRCPTDASGSACSGFKLLYEQSGDYEGFMKDYHTGVLKRPLFCNAQ